ncbi:hypothetical protein D3C79_940280 [compost metagenome]
MLPLPIHSNSTLGTWGMCWCSSARLLRSKLCNTTLPGRASQPLACKLFFRSASMPGNRPGTLVSMYKPGWCFGLAAAMAMTSSRVWIFRPLKLARARSG